MCSFMSSTKINRTVAAYKSVVLGGLYISARELYVRKMNGFYFSAKFTPKTKKSHCGGYNCILPPQILWRTPKNGTHSSQLKHLTLTTLMRMNNYIYLFDDSRRPSYYKYNSDDNHEVINLRRVT